MGRATKTLGGLSIASLVAGVVITMFSMVYMIIPGIITGYALIVASAILEITLKGVMNMASMSAREDVVKLRFKRCVKMELEGLRKTSILYLIVTLIPTAYYVFLMLHSPIIYYVVWFLTVYGTLGLFDLVWYIHACRKCKHIADSSLYDCNSECYYTYCKDKYCYTEAYSACIDMCKQIFNNTSQG